MRELQERTTLVMLTIVTRPRQNGKTSEALRWLAEDPKRVLVCFSVAEAQRIWHLIERDKLLIARTQIISAESSARRLVGSETREIGVDNAEMVLAYLLGRPLGFISINSDDTLDG